jgi:hypothetical protein
MVLQPVAASFMMQPPSSARGLQPPVGGIIVQPGSMRMPQAQPLVGNTTPRATPRALSQFASFASLQPSASSFENISTSSAQEETKQAKLLVDGKPNLTAGVPDIDTVEKQKDAYQKRLEQQAKCEEELLIMKQAQERLLIQQAAEARKRQAILAIDQEAKQAELQLDQQFNAQRMGMQQELQSWKLVLQAQASGAMLDYQARKSQEELLIAKLEAEQAQRASAQKRRSSEAV